MKYFIFLIAIVINIPCVSEAVERDGLGFWGLNQIQSREVRALVKPQKSVVVAVIDTGLDISPAGFGDCLWTNAGEVGVDAEGRDKATNRVDDDHNGFMDDVHGWNFVQNNNDVMDRHGHGTHVAGIIVSVKEGGQRCHRSPHGLQLMPLKYYDPATTNFDNLINTIRAIRYATKMGAQVINYSGGGFFRNTEEERALREAGEKGIVLVAAAGNERVNTDVIGFYPADYPLSNILSVTALERDGGLLRASNFGVNTVKVAAPGRDILSNLPHGKWQLMSGTSQATAFATGVVALLVAQAESRLGPSQIVEKVMLSGVVDSKLQGRTTWDTRLNAYRALVMKDERMAADGRPLIKRNLAQGESEILFDSMREPIQIGQWQRQWTSGPPGLRAPAAVKKPQAAVPLASVSGDR